MIKLIFDFEPNGIVWKDDSLIVHEETDKLYSNIPRIEVEVKKWEPEL